MSNLLYLSRKHGVNPTVSVCWFCGRDKNEMVLTGLAGEKLARAMGRPDGDMPMRTVMDREPCDDCKRYMERGVMLLEVRNVPDAPPAWAGGGLAPEPYRTGRMWVVTPDAVQRWFKPSVAADMLKKRCVLISETDAKLIGLPDPVHEPDIPVAGPS